MIWSGDNPAHIAKAARLLAEGRLLAFPTETVYGLGADANQDEAVMAIYAAKGRPTDHPLIVHIADPEDAAYFADPIPDFAWKLLRAHSPGPLTLILPRRAGVARASAAGQGSIGLRCPSHPVAQALLRAARELGVHGVSGPSANRFGRVSPTQSDHVVSEFGPELDVLDGGACEVGIESTIIDCTRGQPVLLRPGMLDVAALSRTAGMTIWTPAQADTALGQSAPKASGTLASHYAPNAKVKLLTVQDMEQAAQALSPEQRAQVVAWSPRPPQTAGLAWQAMPEDPALCAQALFQTLRDFERMGVREIWVCPVPSEAVWDGVRDRLTRASH
jgi:L-threonylcarbamoyladenylate synthase